ncbi:MAG: hypothetical protein WBC20_10255 [Candidatus Aminicenantaceae bacterium]
MSFVVVLCRFYVVLCRIKNGKIAEEREFAVTLSLMQQLGMELKPKEAEK